MFVTSRDNVGATHLSEYDNLFKYNPDDRGQKFTVNSICIDDLIPLVKTKKVFIKLDIERTEATALSCAEEFFNQVDVRYVLMEWVDKNQTDVERLNRFFTYQGFKPYITASRDRPADTRFGQASARNIFFIR